MKKCFVLAAAFVLTGCFAQAQFSSAYLQEFADHDCVALGAERDSVARENARMRGNLLPVIEGPARRGVWVYYAEPPLRKGRISYHEKRLRNQAKLQAVSQLEKTRGCQVETKPT